MHNKFYFVLGSLLATISTANALPVAVQSATKANPVHTTNSGINKMLPRKGTSPTLSAIAKTVPVATKTTAKATTIKTDAKIKDSSVDASRISAYNPSNLKKVMKTSSNKDDAVSELQEQVKQLQSQLEQVTALLVAKTQEVNAINTELDKLDSKFVKNNDVDTILTQKKVLTQGSDLTKSSVDNILNTHGVVTNSSLNNKGLITTQEVNQLLADYTKTDQLANKLDNLGVVTSRNAANVLKNNLPSNVITTDNIASDDTVTYKVTKALVGNGKTIATTSDLSDALNNLDVSGKIPDDVLTVSNLTGDKADKIKAAVLSATSGDAIITTENMADKIAKQRSAIGTALAGEGNKLITTGNYESALGDGAKFVTTDNTTKPAVKQAFASAFLGDSNANFAPTNMDITAALNSANVITKDNISTTTMKDTVRKALLGEGKTFATTDQLQGFETVGGVDAAIESYVTSDNFKNAIRDTGVLTADNVKEALLGNDTSDIITAGNMAAKIAAQGSSIRTALAGEGQTLITTGNYKSALGDGKKFITTANISDATEALKIALLGSATESFAKASEIPGQEDPTAFRGSLRDQGVVFANSDDTNEHSLERILQSKNYAKTSALSDYATKTYVTNAINDYGNTNTFLQALENNNVIVANANSDNDINKILQDKNFAKKTDIPGENEWLAWAKSKDLLDDNYTRKGTTKEEFFYDLRNSDHNGPKGDIMEILTGKRQGTVISSKNYASARLVPGTDGKPTATITFDDLQEDESSFPAFLSSANLGFANVKKMLTNNLLGSENAKFASQYFATTKATEAKNSIDDAFLASKGAVTDNTKASKLTDYATTSDVNTVDAKFANYTTTSAMDTKLSKYAHKSDLNGVIYSLKDVAGIDTNELYQYRQCTIEEIMNNENGCIGNGGGMNTNPNP